MTNVDSQAIQSKLHQVYSQVFLKRHSQDCRCFGHWRAHQDDLEGSIGVSKRWAVRAAEAIRGFNGVHHVEARYRRAHQEDQVGLHQWFKAVYRQNFLRSGHRNANVGTIQDYVEQSNRNCNRCTVWCSDTIWIAIGTI